MKRTPIRVIVSAIAGLVTFYIVATGIVVGVRSEWLTWQYYDPFHLATFAGRLVTPQYFMGMNDTGMFADTLWANRFATAVTIAFWTLIFGAIYFRFLFRGTKRSNQAMKRIGTD